MREYRKIRQYKLESCLLCGEVSKVHQRIGDGSLCQKCWSKKYRQTHVSVKKLCPICGQEGIIAIKQGPCSKCYKQTYCAPVVICEFCGKSHPRYIKVKGKQCCKTCRFTQRYQSEPIFAIKARLRALVGRALRHYSDTGKIAPSKTYGIDYEAIVGVLGPCPGPLSDYQIDHILPLAAFDLNNPLHIRAAFAPQNHQWLSKKTNLSKQDEYDVVILFNYLKGFEA
jgi:hypothetical protein